MSTFNLRPERIPIQRRTFLRAAGVTVALPMLEAMQPILRADAPTDPPRRAIWICTTLGLHAPSLFPAAAGNNDCQTPYLELVRDHASRFTLFSGLSHPDQSGSDGHSSEKTWLTAAIHPGLPGFRNTISVDQLAREKLGQVTRFASIALSTAGTASQSYSSGGVMVPAESRPSALFEKMFLQGNAQEVDQQRQGLRDGRSILDGLTSQANKLNQRVSSADRERLQAYWDSVRATEQELQIAGAWLDRPKPHVDEAPPQDIAAENDLIGRTRLWTNLIPLIVQTDSSRIITLMIQGRNDIPPIEGVSMDHHNLSHHGQDDSKIAQLQRIEKEIMRCFGSLLGGLHDRSEGSGTLLDSTCVTFGSNLGNANSHDWHNLPILFAGGRYAHGKHVAFDAAQNKPLSNLYLTVLQNHMGLEIERFGTSSGTIAFS